MLRRTLLLILISTPLCAGGGVIEDTLADQQQVEERFHKVFAALQVKKSKEKGDKQERKQAAVEDSIGRPSVEVLPPPPKVLKPSQRELERQVQQADVQARERQGGNKPQLHPMEQILEEEPADTPEPPQAVPRPAPGAPQVSRGGGSLFALATVGILAVCYNGYQKRRKRPSHNILNEKDPSKVHRPIFTQQ